MSGTTRLQRTGLSFIRDKGERLVDAKTKKTIFNLALQSEAVTVKKQPSTEILTSECSVVQKPS